MEMPTRYGMKRGKKKQYFMVKAPDFLGGKDLHYVIANNPEGLIGRNIEVILYDLTDDLDHQFIKVKLKIIEVKDFYAYTRYNGHEYFREYERSLIMRGTSYVKAIRDVETKDGGRFRVRSSVFTTKRITNSRKKAIRRQVFKVLDKWASSTDSKSFIREVLFGKVNDEISEAAKKVYPIREGSGIFKIKVLKWPGIDI